MRGICRVKSKEIEIGIDWKELKKYVMDYYEEFDKYSREIKEYILDNSKGEWEIEVRDLSEKVKVLKGENRRGVGVVILWNNLYSEERLRISFYVKRRVLSWSVLYDMYDTFTEFHRENTEYVDFIEKVYLHKDIATGLSIMDYYEYYKTWKKGLEDIIHMLIWKFMKDEIEDIEREMYVLEIKFNDKKYGVVYYNYDVLYEDVLDLFGEIKEKIMKIGEELGEDGYYKTISYIVNRAVTESEETGMTVVDDLDVFTDVGIIEESGGDAVEYTNLKSKIIENNRYINVVHTDNNMWSFLKGVREIIGEEESLQMIGISYDIDVEGWVGYMKGFDISGMKKIYNFESVYEDFGVNFIGLEDEVKKVKRGSKKVEVREVNNLNELINEIL